LIGEKDAEGKYEGTEIGKALAEPSHGHLYLENAIKGVTDCTDGQKRYQTGWEGKVLK